MNNYIDMKNTLNLEQLKIPAKIMRNGGIVIFPTETVYGIGTNGLDENAIKKLYEVKKRPINKPINLLVANMKMVEEIAENISDLEYKIMEAFFPGPLTIILKKKKIVPNILTANGDTVGVRMPEGKIAMKIVELADVPIATPSANISGCPSGTNIEQIRNDFEGKVDYFVDGGESKIGVPSTIVQVINGVPQVLREGSIRKEDILYNRKVIV